MLKHLRARLHVGQESHEIAALVGVVLRGRDGCHLDRRRILLVLGRVLHLEPLRLVVSIRLLDIALGLLVVPQDAVDENHRQPLVDYLHAKDLDRVYRPHHLVVLLLARKLHLVLVAVAVHVVLAEGLERHSRHHMLQYELLEPLLVHRRRRLRVHLGHDDGVRNVWKGAQNKGTVIITEEPTKKPQ